MRFHLALRSGRARAVVVTLLLAAAATAEAGHVRCRERISLESARFAQTRLKALSGCEEFVIKGKRSGPCPDAVAAARIAKAESQLRSRIGRSCGGLDRTCGGLDDTPLSTVGWDGGVCPGFAAGACANAIDDCADVADCLACAGAAATDEAVGLYRDEFTPSEPGTTVNACQVRIVKEVQRFVRSRSKALQKCWRAVSRERVAGPCPVPGDGKAVLAIAKAQAKMMQSICRVCAESDVCNAGGALTVGEIGFAPSCPDVTQPDGSSCAGPVTTLDDLVACVDCVGGFGVDCVDVLAVPWAAAYPAPCQPAP